MKKILMMITVISVFAPLASFATVNPNCGNTAAMAAIKYFSLTSKIQVDESKIKLQNITYGRSWIDFNVLLKVPYNIRMNGFVKIHVNFKGQGEGCQVESAYETSIDLGI